MKGFWKGLVLGLKTLVTKPLKYLTDPVGATTEVYKEELAKEGLTLAEIDQAVKAFEESGGPVTSIMKGYGSATKAVGSAVQSLGKALNFLGNNFTLVLIVVALAVAAWYLFIVRKAVAA